MHSFSSFPVQTGFEAAFLWRFKDEFCSQTILIWREKNLERATSRRNNDFVSVLSQCISSVLDHIHISSDRVLSYHCQDFSERQFHGVLVRLQRVWRWTLCLLVSFGKRNRASLWGEKRWWVQRRLHFCWFLPSEVAWKQQMLDVILPKQLRHHGVLIRSS